MPRTAGKRLLSPTRRKESEVQQPERKAHRSSDKRLDVNATERVCPQPEQNIRDGEAGPQNKPGKRRYRPGKLALREIRSYQNSTGFLIPKLSFSRVVREISMEAGMEVTRWEARALEAVQEAAEAFLVHLLEDSYICALHAKRSTLMVRDMRLARRIGGHPY